MRARAAHLRSDGGFPIIEVIAAMVVLLVGLGGALKVYDGVAQTAATAKLREQGVSLHREVVEGARGLKYADLGPATLVPKLQAQPGLADASTAPGWQLRRRGITYTLAVGACTVDDPRDSTGPHATATFCATGAGTTTQARCAELLGSNGDIRGTGMPTAAESGDCGLDRDLDGQVDGLGGAPSGTGTDLNADDYKRIVVLVRWRNGGGARYVLQDAVVPSPGAADAVHVTALTVAPATAGPGTTSVAASATTDRPASTVAWAVDGELGDAAAMAGSGTAWSFTWALGAVTASAPGAVPAAGEVVDGTYIMAARAFDAFGQAGADRAETVVVDRRAPFAVPAQELRNDGTSVVVSWIASRERDIATYRVLRESGGTPQVVCEVERAQSCRDAAPPTGPSSYYVLALDAAGRVGDLPAAKLAALAGGTPPAAPTGVAAAAVTGGVQVTWTAPASGAASYRVYRDGTALGDLVGTATASSFTDTAPGTRSRDYYVSALSAQGVESPAAGPAMS
jgi:hypothetical protein